jgi:hypothetical protein
VTIEKNVPRLADSEADKGRHRGSNRSQIGHQNEAQDGHCPSRDCNQLGDPPLKSFDEQRPSERWSEVDKCTHRKKPDDRHGLQVLGSESAKQQASANHRSRQAGRNSRQVNGIKTLHACKIAQSMLSGLKSQRRHEDTAKNEEGL